MLVLISCHWLALDVTFFNTSALDLDLILETILSDLYLMCGNQDIALVNVNPDIVTAIQANKLSISSLNKNKEKLLATNILALSHSRIVYSTNCIVLVLRAIPHI